MLSILSQRLEDLRTQYKLSINDMAVLCSTYRIAISKSAYSSWSKGSRIPAIDSLYAIASTFGVSLDWLTGTAQCPYTEDTVSVAEELRAVPIEILKDAILMHNKIFTATMYPNYLSAEETDEYAERNLANIREYLDPSLRQRLYTLGARANIVMLGHYMFSFYPSPYSPTGKHINRTAVQQTLAQALVSHKETIII